MSLLLLLLAACTPAKKSDNTCSTFREKEGWYAAAKNSLKKCGVSILIQMGRSCIKSHTLSRMHNRRALAARERITKNLQMREYCNT